MGVGICTDAACTYRHTHKLSKPVHMELEEGASIGGGRSDGAPGPSPAPSARAGCPAGAIPVALSCPCPPVIAPVLPAAGSRSAGDAKADTSEEAKGGGGATPPLGVCWMFWKEGQCQKGDSCKFKHQLPPVQTASAACAPPRHGRQSNLCAPEQQGRWKEAESKCSCKRQRVTNVTIAPSPLVHHHVGSMVDQHMEVLIQDKHPAPLPQHVQQPRDDLSSLLALTGFSSTDVVPHAHRAWLVELLDDVKLVTGYAPLQVLAVTRSILRHLTEAVHAQQLAQAQDAGDGAEREEEEGERGCLRGSMRLRGCMSLLHPVKITSLAALEQREGFVRTQLAGSLRQALARQRSLSDQTQRPHENTHEYSDSLQGPGMDQGWSGGGEERARAGAGTCPSGTCFQFFSSGTCEFGGRCKYKHGEHIRALCPGRATLQQKPLAPLSPAAHAPPPHHASTLARIELVMGELSSEPSEPGAMADYSGASARGDGAGASEQRPPGTSGQRPPDHVAPLPASTGPYSRARGGAGFTGGQAPRCGKRHAQGQGQEGEVGMVYLRDATGSLPVQFRDSLSGLELVDALVLCSAFNLVNIPPMPVVRLVKDARHDEAKGVDDAKVNGGLEDANVSGGAAGGVAGGVAGGFKQRLPASSEQYLEVSEALAIAASTHAHYRRLHQAQEAEGKQVHVGDEGKQVHVGDLVADACGLGGRQEVELQVGKEVDLQGVVLSVSPLMCTQKADASRAYFFLVELADLADTLGGDRVKGGADGGRGEDDIASGSGSCTLRSTLVVFQGKALMKWYPFFRVEAALVVTRVRRAKLNKDTPCWRATLPQQHEDAHASGGGSMLLPLTLPQPECLSRSEAERSQGGVAAAGGQGRQGRQGSKPPRRQTLNAAHATHAMQRRVASRLSQVLVDSHSLSHLSLPLQTLQHEEPQQRAGGAAGQAQRQPAETNKCQPAQTYSAQKRMEEHGLPDEVDALANSQDKATHDASPAPVGFVDYEGVVTGVVASLYGPLSSFLPVPHCLNSPSASPHRWHILRWMACPRRG
jgi:hypothetical protein